MHSNRVGGEGLRAIGDCLPAMRGLSELHIGNYYDEASGTSIMQGLKDNRIMRTLLLESPIGEETPIEQMIDFYLRLNQSGRSLLEDPKCPVSFLPMLLERASQNCSTSGSPDVLYEMIRSKPSLLSDLPRVPAPIDPS